MRHLAAPRLKGRLRTELLQDPVVVAFDPGVTTGWSVMKVHPDALSDPQVNILDNIDHWANGQIVGESIDVAVGSQYTKVHEARKLVAKFAGTGFLTDSSPESAAVHEMMEVVRQWPGCAVVMEDFIVRQFNQDRDFLAPVRIMAGMDYALWRMGSQAFRQQPSEAKGAVTDDRLKRWGFYKREGGANHARDADRHSITFLRKMKDPNKGSFRRHMAWPHIFKEEG